MVARLRERLLSAGKVATAGPSVVNGLDLRLAADSIHAEVEEASEIAGLTTDPVIRHDGWGPIASGDLISGVLVDILRNSYDGWGQYIGDGLADRWRDIASGVFFLLIDGFALYPNL